MSDESVIKQFEQAQQITKLSQAIRIGAKLRPQCRDGFFTDSHGTCALGAAYEAVSGNLPPVVGAMVVERLRAHGIQFPEPFPNIICWNDSGMTREAIADKLEAMGY